MLKNLRLLFLLLGILSFTAIHTSAQESIISEIHFEGIKKNNPNYLRRFIKSIEGAVLDTAQVRKDAQSLQNLPALYYVSYEIKKGNGKAKIHFDCNEAHTLLPIVNFGKGGAVESNWFILGATESNLFGRGIQFSGYYQYKEKHTLVLNYRMPNLFNSRWGFSSHLKLWTTNEPLYFGEESVIYQYNNNIFELNGIYEISPRNQLEFGGAYFIEDYERLAGESPLGPAQESFTKYLSKVNHNLDRINYFYFFQEGYSIQSNLASVITEGLPDVFVIFENELKYYKRYNLKGNLALRFKWGVSTNSNSPFAAFVLDSQTNIRGIGDRVTRGTGTISGSAEYRHSLMNKKESKTAIQGIVFSDFGSVRKPGDPLNKFVNNDTFNIHAGVGVRFIFKRIYYAILRVDYGHSLNQDTKGFVIGLGQFF